VNSGIHGSIHGGGGSAPGTNFHPAGPCVTILDSSGTLIAKADCNDRGEFRVNLPAGAYTVQAAGQTLQVRVTAGGVLPIFAAICGKRSGYATDPHYGTLLKGIMKSRDLYRYDNA
jgi:hypothetical protein